MRRAAALAALLAAAAPVMQAAAEPPRRTVSHFREHPAERSRVMAECANDPGRLRNHPDCINAARAGTDDLTGALWGKFTGTRVP